MTSQVVETSLRVGDRVYVTGHPRWSGRVGVIVKDAGLWPAAPGTRCTYFYVLLDMRPRERAQKREMISAEFLRPETTLSLEGEEATP